MIEYDYTTFTAKDLFECKLKGITPNFGYISTAKRQPFLTFCIDAGLLEYVAEKESHIGYKVLYEFAYHSLGGKDSKSAYRATNTIAKVNDYLIFDRRSKPNKHIKQEWSVDKKNNWLANIDAKL